MDAHTNGHSPGASSADERIDLLYSWYPPQAAPAPCPEAAFSLCIKGRLDGLDSQLTVRGQTPAEFKANLASIRGLLDGVAGTGTPPALTADVPQCPEHGAMKKSTRGKGYYCPARLGDETWCKSKAK
jgi:hypothetical protein